MSVRLIPDLLGTLRSALQVNRGTLSMSALTAARTYTFPDSSFTVGPRGKLIDVFRPRDLYPNASDFQTLDTRNSIAVLDADGGSVNETVRGIAYLPLGLDYASGIKARGWITATSATSGNARYGFRIMRFNTSIDTDSFDTAAEAHAAVSGTLGIPIVIDISTTNLDGAVAGEAVIFEWYRDASDTTNDTASGDTETSLLVLETVA